METKENSMHYLLHPDEAICNYIKKHPGTTKHKIAEYMGEVPYCSRITSDKITDNLIQDRKIIDRKRGNSFHRLYINENDTYNNIGT